MVEKGSGRSRGFGFVSFDSAEGASLAIKMMDGYQVCTCIVLSQLISIVTQRCCPGAVAVWGIEQTDPGSDSRCCAG
jgi:hypothetical protein